MPQPPLHANAQLEHLALLAVIDAAPAPDRAHEAGGGEAPPAEESVKEGAGASPLDRAGLIALLQGTASSLDDLIRRQIQGGMPRQQATRIGRALLPFAASIGRDGAPEVSNGALSLPVHDAPSGLQR